MCVCVCVYTYTYKFRGEYIPLRLYMLSRNHTFPRRLILYDRTVIDPQRKPFASVFHLLSQKNKFISHDNEFIYSFSVDMIQKKEESKIGGNPKRSKNSKVNFLLWFRN